MTTDDPASRLRRSFVERTPRTELTLKVEFETVGQLQTDYLTNLSSGGLFLHTELPLPVGSKLQLTISFPGGLDPIVAEVEVRWRSANHPSAQPGLGVQFINIAPAAKARLEQLIAQVE